MQYYQIFCNLSLDVVLGVICSMLPLPLVFDIDMPLNWYIVLPLATWVIYLGDHVIDVTRKNEEYPSPRHRFVKRNLSAIVTLIIVIGALIVWLTLHPFSPVLFFTGVVLSAFVGIHLLIVRLNPLKHSFLNNKELAIAGIYSAGIYAGPLVLLHISGRPVSFAFGCAVLFWLIVLINLVMISIIELEWDEKMNNSSWVRVMGFKRSIRLLYGLFLSSILLFAVLVISGKHAIGLLVIYLMMIVGHLLIFRFHKRLLPHLWYRKLGEALFWLPGLAYAISL